MPDLFRVDRTHKLPAEAEVVQRDGWPHVRLREDGRTVYYPVTKNGAGYLKPSPVWCAWVKDADGKRQRVRLSSNKAAAQVMLSKMLLEAEEGRAGIRTKRTGAGKLVLTDLLAEYERHKLDRGVTPKQATQSVFRCRIVFDATGMLKLADLDHTPVERHLADRRGRAKRDGGISTQTSNHVVVGLKAFGNFLVKTDRVAENPFKHLGKMNVEADIRHVRRALTADEFARLIHATRDAKAIRGLMGSDRAALYTVAAMTGLRANELASLTPASFSLDVATPTVTVEAGYSKHRKKDTVPLHPGLVAVLRPFLAAKSVGQPVWPGNWAKYTQAVGFVRRDLAAARADWLAEATDPIERDRRELSDFLKYEDAKGGKADFHSLRHTFITDLMNSGASLMNAKQLARHASITTTERYSHATLEGTAAAVGKLAGPASRLTTGVPPGVPTTHDAYGLLRTDDETTGMNDAPETIPGGMSEVLVSKGFDDECGEMRTAEDTGEGSTPNRSRTYNLRFRRPMLFPVELWVRRSESYGRARDCQRRPARG
jgi:site-specific recombinase XerD